MEILYAFMAGITPNTPPRKIKHPEIENSFRVGAEIGRYNEYFDSIIVPNIVNTPYWRGEPHNCSE